VVTVTDLTTNVSGATGGECLSEVGSKGSSLDFQSPIAIGDNSRVELSIPGLDNPVSSRQRRRSGT
jgi:hypothetical protein